MSTSWKRRGTPYRENNNRVSNLMCAKRATLKGIEGRKIERKSSRNLCTFFEAKASSSSRASEQRGQFGFEIKRRARVRAMRVAMSTLSGRMNFFV